MYNGNTIILNITITTFLIASFLLFTIISNIFKNKSNILPTITNIKYGNPKKINFIVFCTLTPLQYQLNYNIIFFYLPS